MATRGDARKRTCICTQARKRDTVYSGLNESNLSLLSGTLSLRNPFCCEERTTKPVGDVALWLYGCLIQLKGVLMCLKIKACNANSFADPSSSGTHFTIPIPPDLWWPEGSLNEQTWVAVSE